MQQPESEWPDFERTRAKKIPKLQFDLEKKEQKHVEDPKEFATYTT